MTEPITSVVVRDVMNPRVISVQSTDTLRSCIERMAYNQVHAVPVVGMFGECRGILTSSDLFRITRVIEQDLVEMQRMDPATGRWMLSQLSDELVNQQVGDAMTPDVTSVHEDSSILSAAQTMLRQQVHRLPVVDHQDRVVGIVSTTDLLAAFVERSTE
jgi:CBS domain-containing membrane protein